MIEKTISGWWYVLAGVTIGLALGVLLAWEAEDGEEESSGLGARLLARIPRRVKVAGAVGAVKGAGGEAYREVKRKLED